MEVIRAEALGMCFGVRDALEAAEAVETPDKVTIYGELVHNEQVVRTLEGRGFHRVSEARGGPVPETAQVLITAHGISHAERGRLAAAGKTLIDTTCPLVRRAHDAAIAEARRGAFVVVLGRPGHVEVVGLTGDLPADRFAVVATLDDVRDFRAPEIAVLCQTTTPPTEAQRLRRAIEAANPGARVVFRDTICRPTRDRQKAVLDLLERVEALVVVGGANSNNTRQLARLAEQQGIPACRVSGAEDLDRTWLRRFRVVGLTAGTSTLDATVDEVERVLRSIHDTEEPVRNRETCGAV